MALAGATALAVSAGVFVIALAYALFALVKPYVGAAGAAGVVALSAALFIAVIGLMLTSASKPPKRKPREPESIVERITDFVRSRPVTAVASAIAAGLMAVRNPAYLGHVMRAFMEDREPPRRGR
jgi:uncharacterized PurR-regulated membrane protein YhhQ (DUF165 family)